MNPKNIPHSLIFLYGPPLVGKSTLGKALAEHLDLPFWDLDELIISRTGSSIEQIFSEQGEDAFRSWEGRLLKELSREPESVISLGGGTLTRQEARRLVEKHGRVIVLTASIETLLSRLDSCRETRPLLGSESARGLKKLLSQRQDHYSSFEHQLNVTGKTSDEILFGLETILGRFRIGGMGAPYQTALSPGSLPVFGQILKDRGFNDPLTVITDHHLEALHSTRLLTSLEEAGYTPSLFAFPAGEASKTLATAQKIWKHFGDVGVERTGTVVALGGGVVGDLTGFASAVFHRGVNWVNLPTSLLAMVDASLGGKTGVNLPEGKNLLGAFHPPRLNWVDTDLLNTLPEQEIRNGMAEVIKHGIIAGSDAFSLTTLSPELFSTHREEIISQAMSVKVDIIRRDPYDRDLRRVLNFGHTVGHGVESASGYKLTHGETVSVGMVVETRLAESLGLAQPGLTDRLVQSLSAWELPISIPPGLAVDQIAGAMKRDKKISGGRLQFSLPFALGDVRPGLEVEEDRWRSALSPSLGGNHD